MGACEQGLAVTAWRSARRNGALELLRKRAESAQAVSPRPRAVHSGMHRQGIIAPTKPRHRVRITLQG